MTTNSEAVENLLAAASNTVRNNRGLLGIRELGNLVIGVRLAIRNNRQDLIEEMTEEIRTAMDHLSTNRRSQP